MTLPQYPIAIKVARFLIYSTILVPLYLLQDLGKISLGALRTLFYIFTKNSIPLSISVLSTSYAIVRKGHGVEYEMTLTNCGIDMLPVGIRFAIRSKFPSIFQQRYRSNFKNTVPVHLKGRTAINIKLCYDWQHAPGLVIDNVKHDLNVEHYTSPRTPGKYLLSATLIDGQGKAIEKLTLVQELIE